MSIQQYLRIIRDSEKPKEVIKESVTPVKKDPVKVDNPYRSSEQVLGIVQRMMEDARVPQKPRQGPLRPQTGAGKHKDKKKDQKQGKEKHKGKNLDENSIPFAGLGKHKIGQAGQLRSPGPTGYPKGKLVGGAAESRFGRNRDDQFSIGGRMPRTDRIDRDGPNDQDFSNKMRQQTINRLLDKYPNLTSASFKGKSLPELIQMLREAVKKPNATTRHLRDYPVSDKDVAKPVKPQKKKDDGRKQQFRGTGGLPPTDDDGNVLEQGVAEGSGKNVVKSVKVGNFRHDLVDTGMGWQVRIYNGDELYDTGMSKNSEQKGLAALEDAVAYTEKQTRTKRQGVSEYGTHPSQRVDPRTGKKYVPPKSPLGKGVAEGKEDLHAQLQAINQKLKLMKGGPVGEPNSLAFVGKRKALLKQKEQILSQLKQGVAEGKEEMVQIEYWQQETLESGRWVKTKPIPRATAEKIVNSFERGEIVDVEQGVAEGYSTLELYNMSPKEVMGLLDAKKITWDEYHDYQDLVIAGGPDEEDDFDYTDYSMRKGELGMEDQTAQQRKTERDKQRTAPAQKARNQAQRKGLQQDKDGTYYAKEGMAEEKQKGVDGKACWKGYKRMGTKKKGGKTVDNCVKMESISEGILASYGLKEVSPPGFKGTVKAMKKHPELTKGKTKDGKEKNPWALAWHMKNKGYKSHKKADGSDKD